MVVEWSNRAKKDMAQIWEYYRSKNESAAIRILKRIRSSALILAFSPRIAPRERQLEEFPQEFRSMVVKGIHKIVYYIDGDKVNVVTIWDCRRNPEILRKIVMEGEK
jgi:plasmid stabilization system protein ParE